MKSEEQIQDILDSFDKWIIPSASDWEFPKYNLSLKFHEVCTTAKILKWVLSKD
jgi:hypothetical protein